MSMSKKYYIASVSCGNDSMAMVQELVRRKYPLDEIVFYSNGMDFDCIYNVWEWVKRQYEPLGIKCTMLQPDYDFEDKMFNILVKNRDGSGYHNGYSWCGGMCRWGTTDKIKILDKYCEEKMQWFMSVLLQTKSTEHPIKSIKYTH